MGIFGGGDGEEGGCGEGIRREVCIIIVSIGMNLLMDGRIDWWSQVSFNVFAFYVVLKVGNI